MIRRITLIKKANLVIKEAHRRSGRVLDIGTGTGYFPDMMIARGWKVKAIEKNAQARALAKELFELNVDDEAALNIYKPGTFDVVTLWHVMEHLENLDDMWKKFYELLTEKGVLVIAVPNCSSYDALKYKEYWAAYDVPRHLWHFTPTTMLQWGYKHNFILSARHPMPFDAFYISMLSEKYKKSYFPLLKGFYTGMAAWLSTQSKKERSSSIVYVFRKKQL